MDADAAMGSMMFNHWSAIGSVCSAVHLPLPCPGRRPRFKVRVTRLIFVAMPNAKARIRDAVSAEWPQSMPL
jgi:hypothetical protein